MNISTTQFPKYGTILFVAVGISSREFLYILHILEKKDFAELSKLATIVEGEPKAPLSIATILNVWGRRYFFPWIAPLYPWTIPCSVEFEARKYQVPFLSFWYDSITDWTPISRAIGEHLPLCQWAGIITVGLMTPKFWVCSHTKIFL